MVIHLQCLHYLLKFQNKRSNIVVIAIGDPDDRSLRKVEKEVLIPKIMRERAKTEKCVDLVKLFGACCEASGLSMVIKCRKENSAMHDCYEKWYTNDSFVKECTEIYLAKRSEYRRTGIGKKQKAAMAAAAKAANEAS